MNATMPGISAACRVGRHDFCIHDTCSCSCGHERTGPSTWLTNLLADARLRGALEAVQARDAAVEEARREGAETALAGMAVEWGWGWLPTSEYNPVRPCADEEMARRVARRRNARVVTRRVTEWQAADG